MRHAAPIPYRVASIPGRAGRRARRGVMLILTLWLAVVLAILASSLTSHLIMQTRLMSMRRHRVVADSLARAGVAKAIADLKNDLILDNTEKPQPFDAEGDVWKRPEEGKKDEKLGKGTYTVQVVDENSKININIASHQVLTALLMQLGYEEEDAKLAASAVIDWKDGDDKCAIEGKTDRLENEFYANMFMGMDPEDRPSASRRKDPVTMRIKNDNFSTVDELLSVYGITPEVFFGPGSAEAATMRAEYPDRWAYAEKNRRFQIKKSRGRFKHQLPVGLRDCTTVLSDGSINVNTASVEVLATLLRASGVDTVDPERTAERIVDYRRDGREEDISNNKAFRSLGELNTVGSFGSEVARISTAIPVGVVSRTFTIISTGTTQRYSRTIRLVVQRNWEQYIRNESYDDWRSNRESNREHGLMEGRTTDSDMKSGKVGPDERTVLWPAVRAVQWIDP